MRDLPKKRPLFQIHLSTAIVLMFAAGAMIWANAVPKKVFEGKNPFTGGVWQDKVYGWPIYTMMRTEGDIEVKPERQGSFLVSGIINGIPCLFLLVLLAHICERYIFSREVRKEER
ncbi:MAG TPA: hypothetical protein VKX17_05455 [Planctomycetota bacterium]|nr:hypothetical protein [Planctomycetota bacterium]